MHERAVTRRQFSKSATALAVFGAFTPPSRIVQAGEVSHSAESIRQVITLNTTSERVYRVLTDPKEFTGLMRFSSVPAAPPAEIASNVGGAFALFAGHILGRHLEMVPGVRLVQAWRVADWPPGDFSIARFELKGQGTTTTVVLDHTGFPAGLGQHLADGWHANYWEPMKKYL
jgi:activator of HSP90 ATPase